MTNIAAVSAALELNDCIKYREAMDFLIRVFERTKNSLKLMGLV